MLLNGLATVEAQVDPTHIQHRVIRHTKHHLEWITQITFQQVRRCITVLYDSLTLSNFQFFPMFHNPMPHHPNTRVQHSHRVVPTLLTPPQLSSLISTRHTTRTITGQMATIHIHPNTVAILNRSMALVRYRHQRCSSTLRCIRQ